ncbi:hypothetical protein ACFSJU_07610 [Paradesertivirga mongoliensis]|uniref:LTXXQ motif family protein n=1 Tax=Paradesertivirga mongoliensis TaxID=2100740 RepID=A0ABW4ZJK6_9SPHI|nr:hypothetical protein [Pedobacter mongoliensis]
MKRLYMILLMIAFALSSQAQQLAQPSKEERISNLSKTLSVDKKRAEEIAGALDYNIEKIRSTARDTSLKPQARQALMKQLHEERQAKIKAILTPEQLAMMQAKIAEHQQTQRAKMEQRRQAQQQKIQEERARREETKEDKKP